MFIEMPSWRIQVKRKEVSEKHLKKKFNRTAHKTNWSSEMAKDALD